MKAVVEEKFEGCITSLGATKSAAERVRAMGRRRGMHKYMVPDLLLIGWDMLTEEQQFEAQRQLVNRCREPLPA